LPSALILALDLVSEEEYLLEGQYLYTDDPAPVLRHISRIDEAGWDPLLAEVVELRLASKLALELSNKPELGQAFLQEATLMLADARRLSLFEHASPAKGKPYWTETF
jgi:hypothetical protein